MDRFIPGMERNEDHPYKNRDYFIQFAMPRESVIISHVWQRCRSRQGMGKLIVRKKRKGVRHAQIRSCWHREDEGELPRSRAYHLMGSRTYLAFSDWSWFGRSGKNRKVGGPWPVLTILGQLLQRSGAASWTSKSKFYCHMWGHCSFT